MHEIEHRSVELRSRIGRRVDPAFSFPTASLPRSAASSPRHGQAGGPSLGSVRFGQTYSMIEGVVWPSIALAAV